jgi:RNA polymerase sigma factor (sigma-70 family)
VSSKALSNAQLERIREALGDAVRRYAPPWLRDHHEDLVHAALLRIAELWQKSERKAPPTRPYLQRVAYTAIATEIRRIRRRGEAPLEETGVPTALASPSPAPDRAAASRRLGRAIRDCVDAIRGNRKLAVILHLQGLDRSAIARALSWDRRQVDNNQYRGMEELRDCLREKGYTP